MVQYAAGFLGFIFSDKLFQIFKQIDESANFLCKHGLEPINQIHYLDLWEFSVFYRNVLLNKV
jgi:hypothetical protein